MCLRDVYSDLLASVARSYELEAIPHLIARNAVDIWVAITMPLWSWTTIIILSFVEGCKYIVSFSGMVLRPIIRFCGSVTTHFVCLINELAESDWPFVDDGAAKGTTENLDTLKASIEHLAAVMHAQASQITELQLRQAQELKAIAEILERLHGTHGAAAAEGGETRVNARLTAA